MIPREPWCAGHSPARVRNRELALFFTFAIRVQLWAPLRSSRQPRTDPMNSRAVFRPKTRESATCG